MKMQKSFKARRDLYKVLGVFSAIEAEIREHTLRDEEIFELLWNFAYKEAKILEQYRIPE